MPPPLTRRAVGDLGGRRPHPTHQRWVAGPEDHGQEPPVTTPPLPAGAEVGSCSGACRLPLGLEPLLPPDDADELVAAWPGMVAAATPAKTMVPAAAMAIERSRIRSRCSRARSRSLGVRVNRPIGAARCGRGGGPARVSMPPKANRPA